MKYVRLILLCLVLSLHLGCAPSAPSSPPTPFNTPSTPYYVDLSEDTYLVFLNTNPESHHRLAAPNKVPSLEFSRWDAFGKLSISKMSLVLEWLDGVFLERWGVGSEEIRSLPYHPEFTSLRVGSVDTQLLGLVFWFVYDEEKDLLFGGSSMDGEGWSIDTIAELAMTVYEK